MSAVAALLHGTNGLHHVDDKGGTVLRATTATLERGLPIATVAVVVRILKCNMYVVIYLLRK